MRQAMRPLCGRWPYDRTTHMHQGAASLKPRPDLSRPGLSHVSGVNPMSMRSMTQTLVELDNKLTTLRAQLHDRTWEPDEKAAVRVEIDQLLEQRQALTDG